MTSTDASATSGSEVDFLVRDRRDFLCFSSAIAGSKGTGNAPSAVDFAPLPRMCSALVIVALHGS